MCLALWKLSVMARRSDFWYCPARGLDSKRRFGVFLGNGMSKVTSKWLNSKKKINATTLSQKNSKNVVK